MKIAICDDDINDRLTIEDYIKRYDSNLHIDMFSSAVELMEAFENKFYDLIFLDIQMESLNGFDAAKAIMDKFKDKPLIVFTTRSSKYTIRGYEVAFRYLLKPIQYEVFSEVLTAALKRLNPQKIAISINGNNIILSVKDIYYFEVFDHYTRIYSKDSYNECRYPLKKLEKMLQGCAFGRPHSGYLVNMDYVLSATQSEAILKNGVKINISRHRKDTFLRLFHQSVRR